LSRRTVAHPFASTQKSESKVQLNRRVLTSKGNIEVTRSFPGKDHFYLPDVTATPALSAPQARRLVTSINNQSADVRRLVLQLHEGQGWKALGYDSWKACVDGEFVFGRQHAYRLLEAAQVDMRVSPTGDTKLPERHIRELAVAPPARQAEVYAEAVRSAPESGLTAEHIKSTVQSMGLAPNPWGARAAESNMKDYIAAMDRLTAPQLEVVLRKCFGSIPQRVLFKAVDEARYMTAGEQSEFNSRPWSV
jgi:hypothetical protein